MEKIRYPRFYSRNNKHPIYLNYGKERKSPEHVEENLILTELEWQPQIRNRRTLSRVRFHYDVFLEKDPTPSKKARTYLDAQLYTRLKLILQHLNAEIGITNYIENIIKQHLIEYKEYLKQEYKQNYKKPI
ncbi:MAG: DUF3408 domain-containing protein [Odoribacter sp.]|nr:DUF3408 domain-containing protein [Odoribacter sp.]